MDLDLISFLSNLIFYRSKVLF